MTGDDDLLISGLQHFIFCRRQWALIHIENQWNENYLTAEGRIQHSRVHDTSVEDIRNGILTLRGMQVRSDRLKISGACDAVEFIPDSDGITLANREGLWKVRPVEYKHGNSKINDCDRFQVTAQVLCLEEMLCCKIESADLFYHESRHREHVSITTELRSKVEQAIAEMREYAERGYTPKVKPGKFCKSCSLSDLCLPTLMKGIDNVNKYVHQHLMESDL